MKSARKKKIKLAQIPKIKLKNKHFLAAFFAPISLLHASSSETTLVAEIFIPADASVIPNAYTDITSVKTPTASSPIVFEMNMLKNIFIIWRITELNNKIRVLKNSIFIVRKVQHPFYIIKYINILKN